jgi:F0F1-type ATP synthase assembly protein I
MPSPNRRGFLSRSLEALQTSVQQAGPAATAGYTLVGAILFLGGLGYAIDAWKGTAPYGLVGGLFLGVIVGFYHLIKTVQRGS